MTCIERPIDAAVTAWRAALGPDRVLDAAAAQASFGSCTTGTTRQLAGALRPHDVAQLQALVRIAAQFRTPLHPISSGRNWGYHSSLPYADDVVLVDLSGMRRIVHFDPTQGLVTVEPGVTQGDLADFLAAGGHPYMVPTTGAGPDCSLIGNALERGYGITPQVDHFGALSAIEAVLPDGRRYRPPLVEMGGAVVGRSFKWGIGPYVDGLFAQGSLGIVTQATIALARRPEGFTTFHFGAREAQALPALVDAIRELLRDLPGLCGGINLLNQHRVLAMIDTDLQRQAGAVPLSAAQLQARAEHHGIPAWTGIGSLYGPPGVVAAAKRVVKARLRPHCDLLRFLTPRRVTGLQWLARFLPGALGRRLRHQLDSLQHGMALMAGYPDRIALQLAHWVGSGAPGTPPHPARDGAGLIWYPPLLPFVGHDAAAYVDWLTQTCEQFHIAPLITLTALSERTLESSVPLLFDRQDPAAAARATACYQALFEQGCARGYVPYRLGTHAMATVCNQESGFWSTVGAIKAAVDPHGLIAPGRYAPSPAPDADHRQHRPDQEIAA